MKKQLFIGFIISAICLYYALKGIPLSNVGHALIQADFRWIAGALGLYILGYVARIWRWQILLEPIKHIAYRALSTPLIIGFFANNILPFRMGELIRAHISGKKFQISRTSSLGSIFIERLFDTMSFLTTFLAVAALFPFPHFVKKGATLLGIACVGSLIFLWSITTHEKLFLHALSYLGLPRALKERTHHLIGQFADGVAGMKSFRNIARSFSLSLFIWTIEGTFLFLVMRAYHLGVPYTSAFFLLFFLGLAVTLPQAPGYVGTMELFGTTALSFLGIPKEQALPVILAIHGLQFGFVTLLGFWAISVEGISLAKLMDENERNVV